MEHLPIIVIFDRYLEMNFDGALHANMILKNGISDVAGFSC